MDKKIKKLIDDYVIVTDAAARGFVEKLGMCWSGCYWVCGDSGDMLSMGDYFVDMQTIIDGLKLDATWDDFVKWYDYTLEVYGTDTPAPNFKSWLKGCPRATEEELKELREKVEESRKMFLDSITN